MCQSESHEQKLKSRSASDLTWHTSSRVARLKASDWRAWIALVWVLWFGLLYGKMVVESRGQKLSALVARVSPWK